MAAINRRSIHSPISRIFTLAAADDLDGIAIATLTSSFNVTGASRVVVVQENTGTAGTAGIDVIAISKDGGSTWAAADKVLAVDSNDSTGTELNGILNAAGIEPTQAAVFKCGPYEGPTAIRVIRNVTDLAGSAAWVTGAPKVYGFIVGGNAGTAPSALA